MRRICYNVHTGKLSNFDIADHKVMTKVKKIKFRYPKDIKQYLVARETQVAYSKKLSIPYDRECECSRTHINCQTPKEWIKSQLGVWQFFYEKRDIRDKSLHDKGVGKKYTQIFKK